MSYNISGMYKKAMAGVLGAAMLAAPIKSIGPNLDALLSSSSPQTQQQAAKRSLDSYITMNDAYAQGDAKAAASQPLSMSHIKKEMAKGSPRAILEECGAMNFIDYDKAGNWKEQYFHEVFEQDKDAKDKKPVLALFYDNKPNNEKGYDLRESIIFKELCTDYNKDIEFVAVNLPSGKDQAFGEYVSMLRNAGITEDNNMGTFNKSNVQLPPIIGPPSIAMYATYDVAEGETPSHNDGKIKLLDVSFEGPRLDKDINVVLGNFTDYWIGPNIFLKQNPDNNWKVERLGNTFENWKTVANINKLISMR